jgi:hypothetical protein
LRNESAADAKAPVPVDDSDIEVGVGETRFLRHRRLELGEPVFL